MSKTTDMEQQDEKAQQVRKEYENPTQNEKHWYILKWLEDARNAKKRKRKNND